MEWARWNALRRVVEYLEELHAELAGLHDDIDRFRNRPGLSPEAVEQIAVIDRTWAVINGDSREFVEWSFEDFDWLRSQ